MINGSVKRPESVMSEKESMEAFIDGSKLAASAAKELSTKESTEKRSHIMMLSDFLSGVNTMIDACSQLVHHRINPKMMAMRDMLNIIADGAKKLVKEERIEGINSSEWETTVVTLNAMRDGMRSLMNMRSMSRFETLMAANIKANPKGILN